MTLHLKNILYSVLSFLVVAFLPAVAIAGDGLVPCGRGNSQADACTLCHFFVGFNNVITYLRNIAIFVAIIVIVAAGIMYIMSAGNSSMTSTAKTALKNTVIGIVAILIGWVVITWVFIVLTNSGNTSMYRVGNSWSFACSTTSYSPNGATAGSGIFNSIQDDLTEGLSGSGSGRGSIFDSNGVRPVESGGATPTPPPSPSNGVLRSDGN